MQPIPYHPKDLIILFKRGSEVISFLLYQEKKQIGFFNGFSIIDSTIYIPIKLAIMVTHENKIHLDIEIRLWNTRLRLQFEL